MYHRDQKASTSINKLLYAGVAACIIGVGSIYTAVNTTRVPFGEVGVRINWNKTVDNREYSPGEFMFSFTGESLLFPVKEVAANLDNLQPISKDNSTLADFDMTFIYNINPSSIAELYSNESRSFHHRDGRETYIMFNYLSQLARSAAFKATREYEALEMNNYRSQLEASVRDLMIKELEQKKLNHAITISQVQIRRIQPAQPIIDSANALVQAKNQLLQREVEVKTAEAEAKRQRVLAESGPSTIQYMNAQANLAIAEGIRSGKVNSVIMIPTDFRGQVNVPVNK